MTQLLLRFVAWIAEKWKHLKRRFGGVELPLKPPKTHDFRTPRFGHSIYFSVKLDGDRMNVMGHGCNDCGPYSVTDVQCPIDVGDSIIMMVDATEIEYQVKQISYKRDPRDMFTADLKCLGAYTGP